MERNETARQKAREAAMAKIVKECGAGAAMRMDAGAIAKVPTTSTGSLKLDEALGVGGFPESRIVEIWGNEASGKTTLALQAIAAQQAAGGSCLFIDAEHALDPSYAEALGVSVSDLIISQPDCGEDAIKIADTFIRSGGIDMVVVDSVAALTPKAEIDGEISDSLVGVHARLLSKAMRVLTGSISRTKAKVIFINQLRANIQAMGYGPKTVTTGGNALKYYAAIRLSLANMGKINKGDNQVGNNVKIKVMKNKLAPPFKQVETELIFGKGFSREGELLDLGVDYDLVKKSGIWYSYGDIKIGQGKENARAYLEEHPEVAAELEAILRQKMGMDEMDHSSDEESAGVEAAGAEAEQDLDAVH
jgi:recombination protein RecA